MVLNDHKDANGFTKVEDAKDALMKRRERLTKGRDLDSLLKETQYYPFSIDEAFIIGSSNIFPVALLQSRVERIYSDSKLSNIGIRGELIWLEKTVAFEANPELKEVSYPTKNTGNKEGCITIYEFPYKNNQDVTPSNLYIAGCDPYTQDQADTSPSLGSIFIYKRFINANETSNIIVAEYTGRPMKSEDFYENCRKLLTYYNANCLYENNVPGMKQYFEMRGCLRLLAEQPDIVKDLVKDSIVKRNYGINVSQPIKIYLIERIKSYLLTEFEEGEYNVEKIYSVNLLKELINYSPDNNFDRVIAFGLCLIQEDEYHQVKVKETKKTNMFQNIFEHLGHTTKRIKEEETRFY